MKWLTLQDLELIHMQVIDVSGGSQGVRDVGRLESALASMQQATFGQELHPTAYDKAAVLMRGLIADHPFVDGKKRSGIVSALVFLNLNGLDTSGLADKDLEDFAVQVAIEHLDVPAIANWLQEYSH